MGRYLVVANQTLRGRHLTERIEALRQKEDTCHVHVVVPATPPSEHLTWVEGEATAVAEERLERACEQLRRVTPHVTGEVGDANPVLAIEDAMRREDDPFDGIILSTLPPGVSRWLKMDLPHRVERRFNLPVWHVVGEAETPSPKK